jgi:chromosome segregation protein
LRLTHIKLAGFKSFVDPTAIATPGQLVGIVGPNGCGKSNVIDAVRWVLGESKASALRGESMQDVIFNGAGERKAVGRASVELHFDNTSGRIGGQWGRYSELSIKRVLTRDEDSSYYINNIPVRRRDIYDLFLGTGLGPRAYAIIEQGMISRVIEAKPEELRVFSRRRPASPSTRSGARKPRLGSPRRTRIWPASRTSGSSLDPARKLDAQAKVATEFREHEARLKLVQHLLWFSKQQDAANARERHSTAGRQSHRSVRERAGGSARRRGEARGAAGRALRRRRRLHERQGAFYEANAEVTRLEQQLAFARESETRITQQVAQLTEQLGALAGQETALSSERAAIEKSIDDALSDKERTAEDERAANAALPDRERAVAAAAAVTAELSQRIALAEQSIRVIETKRDSVTQFLAQLAPRRERLQGELDVPGAPVPAQIAEVKRATGTGDGRTQIEGDRAQCAARCRAGAAGPAARRERRRAEGRARARRHRSALASAGGAPGENWAG